MPDRRSQPTRADAERFLREQRSQLVPGVDHLVASHVAAMVAAGEEAPSPEPRSRFMNHHWLRARAARLAVAGAGLGLVGTTGLAYAGELPAPAQDAVAAAVRPLGIHVTASPADAQDGSSDSATSGDAPASSDGTQTAAGDETGQPAQDDGQQAGDSPATDQPSTPDTAPSSHPENHGAVVSAVAHEKGPDHGKAVSAVASSNGQAHRHKGAGSEQSGSDNGKSHAGGNGKSHAGGNGKSHAGGNGKSHAGGNGKSHAGGNGKSHAGGNGKSHAGGNGKSHAGGNGKSHA
jgi:hypothetical protein